MSGETKPFLCFLGTGAGDANYGAASADQRHPRDVRRYTSLFCAPDILIDFSNHTAEALDTFGIAKRGIRHLLISHGHYDHFQPVEILRFAESLPHPLRVYGAAMVRDALRFCRGHAFDAASGRFVQCKRPYNIEVSVLSPGATTRVGDAAVTALLANHIANKPYCIMEQALNFVIERAGKILFYGLDSSYLLAATQAQLARFRLDVAILDATFGPLPVDPANSGHLNWQMLDETLAELRDAGCVTADTVVVADHLSTGNVEDHDEIAEPLRQKGITLAYDGMTLTL